MLDRYNCRSNSKTMTRTRGKLKPRRRPVKFSKLRPLNSHKPKVGPDTLVKNSHNPRTNKKWGSRKRKGRRKKLPMMNSSRILQRKKRILEVRKSQRRRKRANRSRWSLGRSARRLRCRPISRRYMSHRESSGHRKQSNRSWSRKERRLNSTCRTFRQLWAIISIRSRASWKNRSMKSNSFRSRWNTKDTSLLITTLRKWESIKATTRIASTSSSNTEKSLLWTYRSQISIKKWPFKKDGRSSSPLSHSVDYT